MAYSILCGEQVEKEDTRVYNIHISASQNYMQLISLPQPSICKIHWNPVKYCSHFSQLPDGVLGLFLVYIFSKLSV